MAGNVTGTANAPVPAVTLPAPSITSPFHSRTARLENVAIMRSVHRASARTSTTRASEQLWFRHCPNHMRLDSRPDHREYEHRCGQRHRVDRRARGASPRSTTLESNRDPGAPDNNASQCSCPTVSSSEPREQAACAGCSNSRKGERQDAAYATGNGASGRRQSCDRCPLLGSGCGKDDPS